ncbi:MAG: protein phosphatase 2C domain-containing protein [Myxococcota bacterium]
MTAIHDTVSLSPIVGEGKSLTGRLASASLIGREHVRTNRNNQDGHALSSRAGVVVGVVTDGCSSQPSSEVGAQLAARFLANWVAANPIPLADLPLRATEALCAWMYRTAWALNETPATFPELLQRYFLFTFLCAAQVRGESVVFGLGDGGVLVDEQVIRLDAGPDNAPPYAAYRLLSDRRPEPQVHFHGRASRVAVLTDGFDALLARDPDRVKSLFADGLWRNAFTLQRRLNVLGEAEKLSDDATLVVLEDA